MTRLPASLALVAYILAPAAPAAGAAPPTDIPRSLKDQVMGSRFLPVRDYAVDGVALKGLPVAHDAPFLVWPAGAAMPFRKDRAAVAAWLGRAAALLGHGPFRARYARERRFRTDDVWIYALERDGIRLHDGVVRVHWDGNRLVGLVNLAPGPVVRIEDPPVTRAAGLVYYPGRKGAAYELILAQEVMTDEPEHRITSFTREGRTLHRIVTPKKTRASRGTFTEYTVPVGTFPDQIDVDSTGKVWFSQPIDDYLTSFDPGTLAFTQHPTTGGDGPDGMIVDSQDRVWTGLYYNGTGLGRLVAATGAFTAFPPPYANAAMAIPVETSQGTIWVTDHQNNRISEFDPAAGTFLQSLTMPTPNCWVVQGDEHVPTATLYFTEYNVNQLAKMPLGGTIQDIPVPGAGPAFLTVVGGKVYYTEWSGDRLGELDVASMATTEYDYPVAGENGGPVWRTPWGHVACGTRTQGYVFIFDPATSTFSTDAIPTSGSNLKDGLTVAPNGVVWFTETYASPPKIARLDVPLPIPTGEIVTGAGPASTNAPVVKTWNHATPPAAVATWSAYGGSGYGVNVAALDMVAGGALEVATGPGPGAVYGPQVRAFQPAGTDIPKVNFYAYGTLRYGAHPAGGDLDGDPHHEILTSPGPGSVFGPHIRGFNFDGTSLTSIPKVSFFAYATLRYGARVAGADVDSEPAFDEIATGAGAGSVFGPHVRTFNYDNAAIGAGAAFFAFATGRYGAVVDGANTDGDATQELAVTHGPDPAATGEARGFDLSAGITQTWTIVTGVAAAGGAEACGVDLDGTNDDEIVVAQGWGAANASRVVGFQASGTTATPIAGLDYLAYPGQTYGAKVAGGDMGL